MKICDKHGIEKPKESVQTILVEIEGIEYNLCSECYHEFEEWARTPPKVRRNRSVKDFLTGKE